MIGIIGSIILIWLGAIVFDKATYQETAFLENAETGNTPANLSYGGIVAEKGEWIYYRNHSDNNWLYKIKKDGMGKTKIIHDAPYHINVIGDWIYYSNEYYYGNLYKIKTDGTGRTPVIEDTTDSIIAKGDWIYYTSIGTDIGGTDYQMRKIRTLDNNKESLLEMNHNKTRMQYINITKDSIYFVLASQNSWLYKSDLEGKHLKIVNKDASYWVYIIEDWIYYVNGSDGFKLYKMKLDGSSKMKINDDRTGTINFKDGWIYYNNKNDDNKIYKIRFDGSDKKKVSDMNYQEISIAGDWIYYPIDRYGTVYRMRIDGTGNELVE
jgi:hypothetical protein